MRRTRRRRGLGRPAGLGSTRLDGSALPSLSDFRSGSETAGAERVAVAAEWASVRWRAVGVAIVGSSVEAGLASNPVRRASG